MKRHAAAISQLIQCWCLCCECYMEGRWEWVKCLVTFYECVGDEKIFVIYIFICSLQ